MIDCGGSMGEGDLLSVDSLNYFDNGGRVRSPRDITGMFNHNVSIYKGYLPTNSFEVSRINYP